MRLSIERLRWILVAGAVVLIAGLAATIAFESRRAKRQFKQAANKFLHTQHETRNFTYSDALLGRTSYTIHAGRVVQHGDGTYSLFDVSLDLHSKTSTEVDHVYANQIEYDQNTGVGKAIGDVRMELEVPQSVAGTRHGSQSPPTSTAVASPQVVFVETSNVVYVRRLGIAATDGAVRFRWGKVECDARGAEFNPSESTLRLLADVHAKGTLHSRPLEMTAAAAMIDRNGNIADFDFPAARSGDRTGRAQHAVAYLRKDGSIDHTVATGSVVLGQGTAQIMAARMDATLGEGATLKSARLSGGVTMVDTSKVRPMRGSAKTMDASFDTDGAPTQLIGTGQASLAFEEHGAGGRVLHRQMKGETITAKFIHGVAHAHTGAAVLTGLHAVGAAEVSGDSLVADAAAGVRPAVKAASSQPQLKQNTVAADDLVAAFGTTEQGRPLLKTLVGLGHTTLRQHGSEGDESESHADRLDAAFVPGPTGAAQLATARQTGHLSLRSKSAGGKLTASGKKTQPTTSTGTAAEGTYDAASDTLTLSGGTHFSDGQNSLTAALVTVHESSGDAEARGNVLASIENACQGEAPCDAAAGRDAGRSGSTQPVTHVAAAGAKFTRAGKLAEFVGTDAAPARLWQGGSQVQAADLLFDGEKRTLAARPQAPSALVRAVFASESSGMGPRSAAKGSAAGPASKKVATIVHVVSPRLDYSDAARQAVFSGGVKIDGTPGTVEAQRAVVTLSPARAAGSAAAAQANPVNGSLEKVVLMGDVRMRQPGRSGTGDELTYTAADDRYVLTGTPGHPPRIVDAQQGNVTGASLVFTDAGSTIIVSGSPGQPGGRVRTETEVRHQQ